MKKKAFFILVCLLIGTSLVACGPSQAERDAQATQVAVDLTATQTAEAPTLTPTATPTFTPTPTQTLTPTPVPTDTPTPTSTPTDTPTPVPPTATPTSTPTPIPPTATSIPTTGRIEGKVFRSDTNESIANATVTLNDATLDAEDPARIVAEVTADAQGRYSFDEVKPGEYSLAVTLNLSKYSGASPCAPSGGLFFFGDADGNVMFVLTGQNAGGDSILSIAPFSVSIVAGDIVQKDLDLHC